MRRKTILSRLTLLVAALFSYSVSFAYPDTLFISRDATTYLLFAEQVSLVDIGSRGEYLSRIEGKCVFVKAVKEEAAPTSILVVHGEEYFVAVLAYKPFNSKFLYDYSNKLDTGKISPKNTGSATIDMDKVKKHFDIFHKLPQAASRKTARKNHLQLSLIRLQNDKQATYLSFTLHNGSSINYEIDLITFERKQKRGKRFSQNNVNSEFIAPLLSSPIKVIAAKGKQPLHFALPLYALSAGSFVKLSLREKNGSRLLSLKLPTRYINQAPIFNPN
jgi:hypothetical protein